MKQSTFKPSVANVILDRTMHVAGDSRDELDDIITTHQLEGWRIKSRTTSHDGTYMATLVKVTR